MTDYEMGAGEIFAEIEAIQRRLDDILQGVHAEAHTLAVLARARESRAKLASLLSRDHLTICGGVLPPREIALELGVGAVTAVEFPKVVAGEVDCDLLINNHHPFFQNADAVSALDRLRRSRDFVSAVQFRDHHHMYRQNLDLAARVDFVFPGHHYKHGYLRAANMNILAVVPMCSGQWPVRMMTDLFRRHETTPRSDALYGGYGFYPRYRMRTRFIDQVGSEIEGSKVRQWRGTLAEGYFTLPKSERFEDWLRHKVSAVVNTDFCVPNRVFDALAAGQIPLVPHGLSNFEAIISAEEQANLPVMRYSDFDLASLKAAYAAALKVFDDEGLAGTRRRHAYALERHTFPERARRILRELRRMAAQAI